MCSSYDQDWLFFNSSAPALLEIAVIVDSQNSTNLDFDLYSSQQLYASANTTFRERKIYQVFDLMPHADVTRHTYPLESGT